ncbi:hypothetical protein NQ315_004688 [Exocentrus adspersus]|uniref:Uncharacterized protein n=1 Tax=Exocentrus adspersus TaxID=1586481 RepID=A0AAV8V9X5_9CUCU|nr:hypothetical protein NQ315_004688 [Exocentrus adspersus]
MVNENEETRHSHRNAHHIPSLRIGTLVSGQKFAILEMKTCLSKIIRNFRLQPSSPAEYELQLCPRVILASNNGIRLSLRKRICE